MSITFHATNRGAGGAHRGLLLGLCGIALLVTPAAQAANLPGLTVIGIDHTVTCPQDNPTCNQTVLGAYRWVVEEDRTYHVQTDAGGTALPSVFDPNWPTTLSVSFHKSYMPVVAKGCVGFGDLSVEQSSCDELGFSAVTNRYYYVSVLPRDGYTIGGAAYDPTDPNGTTVYVYKWPIPTAQISILVFEDNFPINNAPDLPAEDPANPDATDMSGFRIIVEDAGGRYGASAGIASQDAFGNPLCTEYQYTDTNGNGVHDTGEPYVPGPDGLPIVTTWGTGCRTDANGRVLIKHLAPGKYGIQAVPPGPGWQQTSTIEGTKVIDAWVKANEPPFFAEFGPVGFHVFIGFVKQFDCFAGSTEPNCQGVTPGLATISGKVVNMHLSRPPDYAFYMGACFGHTTPWVGLNDLSVGIGKAIYVAPTDGNCNFSIANVPDGNYQLALFDNNLDLVFGFKGISIVNGQCSTPSGSCNLGDVPLFQWFTRMEHHVYYDLDGDGFPDDGEPPMLEQNVILRWRDGTIYQAFPTDAEGVAPFDQVFPFFSWQVAEVDFARYEATGVTISVDNGGAIPAPPITGPDWTAGGHANPQDQTNPGDSVSDVLTTDYRTESGPVLTQGFQGFLGQTSSAWWGKRHYADGENGGISGIVFYATTRAENDVRYAVAEVWEPGIPGVTVNLYGPGPDGQFQTADDELLDTTTTDSWDDSLPTDCQYGNDATGPYEWTSDGGTVYTTDCYDGLRNFNQVRPGVFDGGYAFGPQFPCADFGGTCPAWLNVPDSVANIGYLKPGEYIVEVVPPPGYDLTKPEDKNVDFGDEYFPSSQLLPPPCVGPLHTVPPALTLYPDGDPDEDGLPGITAPFAGEQVRLCDRKLVTMSAGANAAADFFLHTEVPIASHAIGFILDDTQNEFDPNSPQFGEKYAPPFVPVAIRDWTGREIGRTLSDQYGRYNFLAPSTSTANLPMPSGMSPNMLTTCMNDKTLPDGSIDPNHNPIYSQFCYTFQYMPGATVYLDTPVVPVGAFAGPDQFPLDCEFPDGTPRVWAANGVDNPTGGGPYLPTASGTLTIDAVGTVPVPNPLYCNPSAVDCPAGSDITNPTIDRDYGFGDIQGEVFIGDVPAPIVSWVADQIQVTVTPVMATGQLRIVRGDNGRESINAVTVQIGLRNGAVARPVFPAAAGDLLASPIQDAIDVAGDNDLILVGCGSYSEMVIMWKPVQLQGAGECTTINAVKAPPDKLALWRGEVETLLNNGDVDLLPGQEQAPGNPEPTTLMTEEGAGVLVLARAKYFEKNPGARIDGFRITGADTGGGIILNGYAAYVEVSNNRLENNQGVYGGGIRVGHPTLVHEEGNTLVYTDALNDFVTVHHNHVVRNGGLGGAGGGISMCTGADSYRVTDNYVCGNFNTGNGGGIGHIGLSTNEKDKDPMPLIADNTVIFNEIFNQGVTVSGGGLFIGGAPPLVVNTLSPGAGNVQVIGNLVQGNSAGAGDGGGARLVRVNGQDVADNKKPEDWYSVDLFNNIFVNNVAALAGGGVSLQDAVKVRLVHNTIAHNDSTATASEAFNGPDPNISTPQPGAGIVSRTHSTELTATGKAIGTFSDPIEFADNIVWHNRQFYFKVVEANTTGEPSIWGLCPQLDGLTTLSCAETTTVYDDLGVVGAGCLSPTYSILTDLAEDAPDCSYNAGSNNLAADPQFVTGYVNGADFGVVQPEINTAIQAPAAFDEGGNFIRIKFGPLSINVDLLLADGIQVSDYHLLDTSPALDAGLDLTGLYPELALDFDDEGRPFGAAVDIGADEVQSAPAGNQGQSDSPIVRETTGTRRVGGGA